MHPFTHAFIGFDLGSRPKELAQAT